MFRYGSWCLTIDRRGVSALEYALVAAVMGALIVTAVTSLGSSLDTAYIAIGIRIPSPTAGLGRAVISIRRNCGPPRPFPAATAPAPIPGRRPRASAPPA